TPTPEDYKGQFISVTLSKALVTQQLLVLLESFAAAPIPGGVIFQYAAQFNRIPIRSVGGGFSIFGSPTVTYTDPSGKNRYSHGFTPFSTSFILGYKVSGGFSIGLSWTYYFLLFKIPYGQLLPDPGELD